MSEIVYGVSNAFACQELALRATRANRVFRADEKRIRTKNTVMDKGKDSAGGSYKIADCVRTAFRPHAIGDPRGRVFVRAKSYLIRGTRP